MNPKIKIIIATANAHKMQEIAKILSPQLFDIKSLADFPQIDDIEETGSTFRENARIKAKAVFDRTGIITLADDSGLEVDALNGEPGVYSARYSGPNKSHAENNKKLLASLAHIAEEKRGAQFRCVVSIVSDKMDDTAEGIIRGKILTELRGEKGFGYDPLFVPEGYNKSFAELGEPVKNEISHRAIAFKAAQKYLVSKLKIRI